jgi:hypothetical protein
MSLPNRGQSRGAGSAGVDDGREVGTDEVRVNVRGRDIATGQAIVGVGQGQALSFTHKVLFD